MILFKAGHTQGSGNGDYDVADFLSHADTIHIGPEATPKEIEICTRGTRARGLFVRGPTSISDETMNRIAQMQGLEAVSFKDVSCTDSGFLELAALDRLQQIEVIRGGVSPSAFRRFREKRPNTNLLWSDH